MDTRAHAQRAQNRVKEDVDGHLRSHAESDAANGENAMPRSW